MTFEPKAPAEAQLSANPGLASALAFIEQRSCGDPDIQLNTVRALIGATQAGAALESVRILDFVTRWIIARPDRQDDAEGSQLALEAAAQYRKLGRFKEALEAIHCLLVRFPDHVELAFEKLLSLKYQHRYGEASAQSSSMLAANPGHAWRNDQIQQFASVLRMDKQFLEALEVIEALPRDSEGYCFERDSSRFFREATTVDLPSFSIMPGHEGAATLEKRVLSRLLEAVERGQALSMIRLGDGEGNILGARLFDGNLALRNWGIRLLNMHFTLADAVDIDKVLAAVADLVSQAVDSADIVGIIPVKSLHSPAMPADRQLAGDMCNHIYLSRSQSLMGDKMFCDSHIATSTTWARGLVEIVSRQKFIGVIGAHQDAVATLRKLPSIESVRFHEIPIESKVRRPDEIHFPVVFDRIVEEIDPPFAGALYLVGAGPLGKYYCHVIRERGGVAVDIGSLMDALAGLTHTRSWIKRRSSHFLKDIGLA